MSPIISPSATSIVACAAIVQVDMLHVVDGAVQVQACPSTINIIPRSTTQNWKSCCCSGNRTNIMRTIMLSKGRNTIQFYSILCTNTRAQKKKNGSAERCVFGKAAVKSRVIWWGSFFLRTKAKYTKVRNLAQRHYNLQALLAPDYFSIFFLIFLLYCGTSASMHSGIGRKTVAGGQSTSFCAS